MDKNELAALQKKAEGGDVEAQFQLAYVYRTGKAGPVDEGQAAYWYNQTIKTNRPLAEQGNADAQYCLSGICIARGGASKRT